MPKRILWLFIGTLEHPDVCYAVATAAWAACEAGVLFECYLECHRTGNLFAQTGSTVIGGRHHQQFNYLNARLDVKLLILGEATVFASSAHVFDNEVLVHEDTLETFYQRLFAVANVRPACLLFAPRCVCVKPLKLDRAFAAAMHNAPKADTENLDVAPYLHSEIFFSKAAAYPAETLSRADKLAFADLPRRAVWMPPAPGVELIDALDPLDDYGTLTLRLARRWLSHARGVAFGDPDAIRSQIPSLCRDDRVSVYAPAASKPNREVVLNTYTENASPIADETAQLALSVNNPVLVGRQTGDADLFLWGAKGVSIQIMDPNRPAFPVVAKLEHPWIKNGGSFREDEPDDAALERWASEGKVLASLIFHSGEMAHNEAMVNLMDLCAVTGLKLGLATHLARYETCPQFWEMLQIPVARGGVRGLVEPVLHSGGLGVMAEFNCPPDAFYKHMTEALEGIRQIAGDGGTPLGYYFFCDTDLDTLTQTSAALYKAVADAGLRYAVSSARPGRNRLLAAEIPVLTQTSRIQCVGSPFVRITTREDIRESGYAQSPGWFIGVLDAPVISFDPYIWRKGGRFMDIVDRVTRGDMINVLPDTVARYAAILQKRGDLPEPM